jgi:hypothetical protein
MPNSQVLAESIAMPDLFIPTIPRNSEEAIAEYDRINQLLGQLRSQLLETSHYDWLSQLIERYSSIALGMDLYATQRPTTTQSNVERLQRQIEGLNAFTETMPEDLWPRGP